MLFPGSAPQRWMPSAPVDPSSTPAYSTTRSTPLPRLWSCIARSVGVTVRTGQEAHVWMAVGGITYREAYLWMAAGGIMDRDAHVRMAVGGIKGREAYV